MRINDLPLEMQSLLLSYLCPSELALAARTCKLWQALSQNLFKIHYNAFPYVPVITQNYSRAFSEKMKIVNNIRKSRFSLINYPELPLHKQYAWIEKVKKDTVLPITGFGDYFSFVELNSINLNFHDYPTLDCTEVGALLYASPLVLYYYNGQKYAVYAPLAHHFQAPLKAIVLGDWDFIIPSVKDAGGIQIFRFQKAMWTKLFFIQNAKSFKILYENKRLIIQVSEKEIHVYPIHYLKPQHKFLFDEPIRFFKVQHGLLHTFSGFVNWQTHDINSGKQVLNTTYRVRNARFITERKFTQIVSRKIIACRIDKTTTLVEIDLPPFARIIKAILAERIVFFCYSFRETFFVEGFDLLRKERIKLCLKPQFVFNVPINLYYENGYLLCHSRLFDIVSIFNFRSGI